MSHRRGAVSFRAHRLRRHECEEMYNLDRQHMRRSETPGYMAATNRGTLYDFEIGCEYMLEEIGCGYMLEVVCNIDAGFNRRPHKSGLMVHGTGNECSTALESILC